MDVASPGNFRVVSEDNGNDKIQYQLITLADSLLLNASGERNVMSRKEQNGSIRIDQSGPQQIVVYPTVVARSNRYEFKGLELVPVD